MRIVFFVVEFDEEDDEIIVFFEISIVGEYGVFYFYDGNYFCNNISRVIFVFYGKDIFVFYRTVLEES